MYNTWFGDCFRLKEEDKNIFVDFGIHHMCMRGGIPVTVNNYSSGGDIYRDNVHEAIAQEIVKCEERPDLLVSHYHLDHISGLLYMKSTASYHSPIFNKVYLPNIWDLPNSKNIIA